MHLFLVDSVHSFYCFVFCIYDVQLNDAKRGKEKNKQIEFVSEQKKPLNINVVNLNDNKFSSTKAGVGYFVVFRLD